MLYILTNPASNYWKHYFIQLLLNRKLVSSMQPAWYPACIYGRNYFNQSSFYFNTGMFSSIPLPFRERVFFHQSSFDLAIKFFHQSSFHFKVTISNNFVDFFHWIIWDRQCQDYLLFYIFLNKIDFCVSNFSYIALTQHEAVA